MEKKPISKAIRYFYGVGDLCFTLMTNLSGYLYIYFLTNVNKFPLATIAVITSVNSIISAFTSPIYGAIMNTTKPMKWGRYRSWLIATIPITVVFTPLVWAGIGSGSAVLGPVLCVLFGTIGSQAFNFSYSANVSLIAIIANTPEERAQMSATRGMWNNLSKVMWAYVGTPFVALMGALLASERMGYYSVSLIFCLLYAVGYYIHFIMTKGYEPLEGTTVAGKKKEKTSFGDLWKALIQNPHLLTMLVSDMFRWLVNFTMQSAAIYFFKYTLNNLALQSTYLLCANFCAIIGAYIMKYFVKSIGTRNTGIAAFFCLAIFLLLARVFYLNTTVVMVLLIVAQLFLGIAYTTIPALYADAVTYSQWKMGKNAAGFIMGLQNVPLKCSGFIKNLIITGMLAAGGYSATIEPAAATPALKAAIANMFIGAPGAFMLLGAFIFLFGYRLTTAKMDQYKAEIAAREE